MFLDEDNYCREYKVDCPEGLPMNAHRRNPRLNGFHIQMPDGSKAVITTGVTTAIERYPEGRSGAVTITALDKNNQLIGMSKIALFPEANVERIHQEIQEFLKKSGLSFREVSRLELFRFDLQSSNVEKKAPALEVG